MHELSLCGAIADIVRRRAADRRVGVIHLRIGELRQVVPDTLAFCWTLVTADTELDGSTLEVERVTPAVHCGACGRDERLDGFIAFACPACGDINVDVVAGEEFEVTAFDLAEV